MPEETPRYQIVRSTRIRYRDDECWGVLDTKTQTVHRFRWVWDDPDRLLTSDLARNLNERTQWRHDYTPWVRVDTLNMSEVTNA